MLGLSPPLILTYVQCGASTWAPWKVLFLWRNHLGFYYEGSIIALFAPWHSSADGPECMSVNVHEAKGEGPSCPIRLLIGLWACVWAYPRVMGDMWGAVWVSECPVWIRLGLKICPTPFMRSPGLFHYGHNFRMRYSSLPFVCWKHCNALELGPTSSLSNPCWSCKMKYSHDIWDFLFFKPTLIISWLMYLKDCGWYWYLCCVFDPVQGPPGAPGKDGMKVSVDLHIILLICNSCSLKPMQFVRALDCEASKWQWATKFPMHQM